MANVPKLSGERRAKPQRACPPKPSTFAKASVDRRRGRIRCSALFNGSSVDVLTMADADDDDKQLRVSN